jgi:hypothetical protein
MKIECSMYQWNVIAGLPEVITGEVAMPAADHLFTMKDGKDIKVLKEERALACHHMDTQLLLMLTRARREVQMAAAFLTTRAKIPDENHWGKLK